LILSQIKRLSLITGKGGVGRSTLAAVFAKTLAASGKKTLLAELEDDHQSVSALARCFQRDHFRDEATEVENNLLAMRLSASVGQALFLNSFLKISALSNSILKNKGVQWFLEGAPAFREMGFFYHLLLQLRRQEFEYIVLDLPATGHLVGLAKLPRILLRLIPIGPIAERLKEGQSYFYDTNHTSAWIVTLPQTLPVSEAIELKSALVEETIPIGGFILNRAPFNPFTHEEQQELDAVFSEKSDPQGLATSLERIRRLKEAKRKLCDERLPLWVAQEVFQPIQELTSTSPLKRVVC
jgi:anion-transporting  ArsA/GET3 family ATPase